MEKLVRDIMTPGQKLITAREDTPITDIANTLFKYNFNGLPVVNDNFELVGVVSERDLLVGGQNIYLPTFLQLVEQFEFNSRAGALPAEFQKLAGVTAGQIMKKNPFTVHPSMPVAELAKILAENHINPIPVVELGKLAGIASRSDVVKLLAPERLNEKPREQKPGENSKALDPLFQKAVVKLEKGFIVIDRLRVRLWWVFLLIAFVIGFFVSIAWLIRINL